MCPSLDLFIVIASIVRGRTPVIVGITEPNVNPHTNKISCLPDRQLIYHRSGRQPARAAILRSDGLQLLPMPHYTGPDIATAVWRTGSDVIPEVVVCSCYMDIHNSELAPWPDKFRRLALHCYQTGLELIVLSDTNCHSTLWGMPESNPRGDSLEELMYRYGLLCLNVGGMPDNYTYYRANARTITDVSMCTARVRQYIQGWEVTDLITTSDHRYIQFQVQLYVEAEEFVRDWKKGDWKVFRSAQDAVSFPEIVLWTPAILDDQAVALGDGLSRSVDQSHPPKKKAFFVPTFEWFNKEVDAAKAKQKKAHDKWRNNKSEANHAAMKAERKLYWKVVMKNKRKSWQSFVEGRINFEMVAQFNRILNRRSLNEMGLLKGGGR